MKNIFLALVFTSMAAIAAFSQDVRPSPTPTPDAEKEKAQVMRFLRDLDQEISNLRLPENRIAYFAELGAVMWQFDETQARTLYGKAISDLQQLIAEHNSVLAAEKAAAAADPDALTVGFTSMGGLRDAASRGRALNGIRRQILLAIAQNDLDLAMNGLTATANIDFGESDQEPTHDDWLVQQLAEIGADKSPKQALALALESLKKGLESRHFSILYNLAASDPASAKQLAAAIMSKAKEGKASIYILTEFLRKAEGLAKTDNKEGKSEPLYTKQDLREIAGLLADEIEDDGGSSFISLVEKYLPARAAALKAKFRSKGISGNMVDGLRVPGVESGYGSNSMASNSNSAAAKAQAEKWKKQREDRNSLRAFSKLAAGTLPPEEREKVLAEARKTVARLRDPRDKIIALSAIATGVVNSDKALALDLMREADRLAPTYPTTYADCMVVYSLASGYVFVDPEQAFPRFEALISRLNELIGAGVKLIEFIDVQGDTVKDGEIKLGSLGGLTGLGILRITSGADLPLRRLAEFDLPRTQALADRFDRPEARVLAKILILRAFSKKFAAPNDVAERPEVQPDELK